MGKRFTEYSQFDLSQVNKDVLKKWDENKVFAKSMTSHLHTARNWKKSCQGSVN